MELLKQELVLMVVFNENEWIKMNQQVQLPAQKVY